MMFRFFSAFQAGFPDNPTTASRQGRPLIPTFQSAFFVTFVEEPEFHHDFEESDFGRHSCRAGGADRICMAEPGAAEDRALSRVLELAIPVTL